MNLTVFEGSKQVNEFDQPYRTARELAKILEYSDYRNFLNVIKKAKTACKKSGYNPDEHFVAVTETQNSRNQYGEIKGREVDDMRLSRYACYLVVQNADPSKGIVASGQTYFAQQTRKQELSESNEQYIEDQRRVDARKELTEHNKSLASTAKQSGVKQYAQFQDAGYQGLYGGLRAREIRKKKGLEDDENMLDYMSSEELGANLFRATQTEAKLKRDLAEGKQIGQVQADKMHYEVGQKVRSTIKELGGTMPEELPLSDNIKESKKRLKSMEYEISEPLLQAPSAYEMPHDIQGIQQLVSTIKEYPGDQVVKIGEEHYKVSPAGMAVLESFLEKKVAF